MVPRPKSGTLVSHDLLPRQSPTVASLIPSLHEMLGNWSAYLSISRPHASAAFPPVAPSSTLWLWGLTLTNRSQVPRLQPHWPAC